MRYESAEACRVINFYDWSLPRAGFVPRPSAYDAYTLPTALYYEHSINCGVALKL